MSSTEDLQARWDAEWWSSDRHHSTGSHRGQLDSYEVEMSAETPNGDLGVWQITIITSSPYHFATFILDTPHTLTRAQWGSLLDQTVDTQLDLGGEACIEADFNRVSFHLPFGATPGAAGVAMCGIQRAAFDPALASLLAEMDRLGYQFRDEPSPSLDTPLLTRLSREWQQMSFLKR